MRLWHYALIPALPRGQLLSQLRECVAIAKGVHENGTPNHLLVNKVIQYQNADFLRYVSMVVEEFMARGYSPNSVTFEHLFKYCGYVRGSDYGTNPPFDGWHDDRYLRQCYYNLEEKHDCGGISDSDFEKILEICRPVLNNVEERRK